MNSRRLLFAAGLLAISALAGTSTARACKYCWSAENSEAADYARQAMQSAAPTPANGAFPLDGTISQFQPATPSATLATAPAAGAVVTSGADLRAARAAAATNLPPAPKIAAKAAAEPVPRGSTHFADAGLLGLATVGGVFCWRTRRKSDAAR